jgi:HSP20 family protein
MTLVRWNPARELATMEVDRLQQMFGDWLGGTATARTWTPAVDIFENDSREYVIKAELPELKREDIQISVENNVLTLKGERTAEFNTAGDGYHRIERQYGSFSRAFVLPNTVDTNAISAAYKDGVLTLRIPQREDAKPRQIQVQE